MPGVLDPRQHVRVHSGMPEHPKVETLSDAAFRCLVEAWCLCRRTGNDGLIPVAVWNKRWKLKARKEVIAAGLASADGDVVEMHDWLDHQPTAAALDAKRTARQKAGSRGGKRSAAKRSGKQNASIGEAIAQANAEAIATHDHDDFSTNSAEISSESHPRNDTRYGVENESGSDSVQTDGPADTSPEGQAIASTLLEPIAEANGQAKSNQTKTKTKNSRDLGGNRYASNTPDLRNEPPPKFHPGHATGYVPDCAECAAVLATRERWLGDLINAVAPARVCPRHPTGTPDSCRDCQAARERHDRWQADRARATEERRRTADAVRSAEAHQAAEDRASEIAGCRMCDDDGRIDGWVCKHDPERMPKPGRGAAAVLLAKCRLCDTEGDRPDGSACDHRHREKATPPTEPADPPTDQPAATTPASSADTDTEDHAHA